MSTSSDFPFDPQLYLSPGQKDLLVAALNSNQPGPGTAADLLSTSTALMDPTMQGATSFANGFPDLYQMPSDQFNVPTSFEQEDDTYNYDFDADGGYDFDGLETDGSPGALESTERESTHMRHEKRKSLGETLGSEDGGGKRHEGEDKQHKKPGRKPLTSEPTTKRKAQNRAAQRAFRERKEKHLRDLETKVEDLEKTSESTSHENSLLRAQVQRMQAEIKEYRRRLQSGAVTGTSRQPVTQQSQQVSDAFNFDFPVFGNANRLNPATTSTSSIGPVANGKAVTAVGQPSLLSSASRAQRSPSSQHKSPDSVILDDLFQSPPVDSSLSQSSYDFKAIANSHPIDSRMGSLTSSNNTRGNSVSSLDFSASPSTSSNSQAGQNSSCGTSPEPTGLSPAGSKLDSSLLPISEETAVPFKDSQTFGLTGDNVAGFMAPPGDLQPLDWLVPPNNISFDGSLFNDYREPDLGLIPTNLDSLFTNEAFMLPDFDTSPFHPQLADPLNMQRAMASQPLEGPKKDFPGGALSHNKIWDRISNMPDAEEIDIDSLCSELRSKAKCTENGLCVADEDFNAAVEKIKTGS